MTQGKDGCLQAYQLELDFRELQAENQFLQNVL